MFEPSAATKGARGLPTVLVVTGVGLVSSETVTLAVARAGRVRAVTLAAVLTLAAAAAA